MKKKILCIMLSLFIFLGNLELTLYANDEISGESGNTITEAQEDKSLEENNSQLKTDVSATLEPSENVENEFENNEGVPGDLEDDFLIGEEDSITDTKENEQSDNQDLSEQAVSDENQSDMEVEALESKDQEQDTDMDSSEEDEMGEKSSSGETVPTEISETEKSYVEEASLYQSSGEVSNNDIVTRYDYELNDDNKAVITNYEGNASVLSIPDTIDGYSVVGIGDSAFNEIGDLQTVIIPDTVTDIQDNAFKKCISLSTIQFGNSVENIGGYAFENCSSLKQVFLPDSLEVLGCGAFQDCIELNTVYLPRDVKTGEYCGNKEYPGPFMGCMSLRNIQFAEGYTELSDGLFWGSGIETIELPDTLTAIRWKTFSECENLKNIVWNESLTEIGTSAFSDCISLETVILPDSLEVLGCGAFQYCTALNTVYLPRNIKTGEYCGNKAYPGPFMGCDALRNIQFAEGYTELNDGLFWGCGIETIELPDTLTAIRWMTFSECENLKAVVWNESLVEIGRSAFSGCTALKDATLPDSVNLLDCEAFAYCTGLETAYIPMSLKTHEYTGNREYYGPFDGCSKLKTVTLQDGITSIPNGLFWGCTGLEEIEIPLSVVKIGWRSFEETSNLQSIIIPDSVTEVSNSAFAYSGLTEIEIPESVTYLGESVFSNCENLSTAILPNTFEEIPISTFESSGLTEFTIPDSVIRIRGNAFANCSNLRQIYWGESVRQLRAEAFKNCDALTELNVPETVDDIYDEVFEDCDGLIKVSFPDSFIEWGIKVFYDCDALKEISLGAGVKTIPESTFEHCDVLESIVIPHQVTSIEDNAFKSCVKFTAITIPRSTVVISTNAFSYPSKMTIYGVEGSYAEEYAASKKITFVSIAIPVESLRLKEAVTLQWGESTELTVVVGPENATDLIVWESSDESIVTVDQNGHTEATGYGTADITVSAGDLSASCTVMVPILVEDINFQEREINLLEGETWKAEVEIEPETATNRELNWWSDNESVAKVDDKGLITAVGEGTATITAEAADGSGCSDYCIVTVSKIDFSITSITVPAYNKLKLEWSMFDAADGYMVYRKGNGEPYSMIKSLTDSTVTSFTNSVTSGVKFTYKVSAYKMDGKKKVILAQTEEMSGTALPAAPVMKSAGMAAFNKIKVIWTKVSGCAGYVIYRSTEEDGKYSVLKTVTMATATEYSNIVQDGQTYYYKIRAFVEVNGKKVYGDYSEVLSGDVIDAPPANFRLEQRTATKIIFNWDKVEDSEGYVIYRYFPDTNKCKAIKNITSKDTLTYTYKVEADTDYIFTMRAFRVVNGKKVYSDYTEQISN